MNRGVKHNVKSIFAIAMAAILRVVISSPRLMAGELPLIEQSSRSHHEFHLVADEIHRALTMVAIGKWVGDPTVDSRVSGGAAIKGGANGIAPHEFSGLLEALPPPMSDFPRGSRLVGAVPAAVPAIGIATITIVWFRRTPAAAT